MPIQIKVPKLVLNRHCDGVIRLYSVASAQTSFGAATNPKRLSDLVFVVKAPFEEQSCRERDYDFAEQHGWQLQRKVRIRSIRIPAVQNSVTALKAVIGNKLYDISYADPSGAELYLYLEGERDLEPEPNDNDADS